MGRIFLSVNTFWETWQNRKNHEVDILEEKFFALKVLKMISVSFYFSSLVFKAPIGMVTGKSVTFKILFSYILQKNQKVVDLLLVFIYTLDTVISYRVNPITCFESNNIMHFFLRWLPKCVTSFHTDFILSSRIYFMLTFHWLVRKNDKW